MELFRTKVWWWLDIGLLKLCAIVVGMIAGAYVPDFVQQHVWVFVLAAVILAIRPAVTYFGNNE